ncbi:putative Ig domain-containing protein [Actinoplanes sp. NPDC051411]|uniref:putative Ig domain-containing protein n=1 Tax=Actinoplanes sp. NPDC051411 TaxID=3155522 RepID=UPI00342A6442
MLERRTRRSDEGFTMAEVLVAIAVVSVVMLSLSAFFVNSIRIDSEQGDRQSAIQAADDAMERARSVKPEALVLGRDQVSSARQWSAPIAAVAGLLTATDQTMWADLTAAPDSGDKAFLPTTYRTLVLNGLAFRQYWYLGTCERPSTGGACVAQATTTRSTAFYRVIVGVTWPGRSCLGGICSYVTSTLVAEQVSTEPVFDTSEGTPPPVITGTTGTQTSDAGTPASLTFTTSGGATPMTWNATSLPAGLSIDPLGGAISGTPTTAGTSSVTVAVIDANGQKATSNFSWTVNPALGYAGFTPPASRSGTAIAAVTLAASNGTKPYAWSAGGLPPGLTLDGSSGVIAGTPSTKGTYAVTTKVTDAKGATVSKTTTWTVS